MKVQQVALIALLVTLTLSATIDSSPVNVTNNGLDTPQKTQNSTTEKKPQDMTLDELDAMINGMLQRMQQSQEQHPIENAPTSSTPPRSSTSQTIPTPPTPPSPPTPPTPPTPPSPPTPSRTPSSNTQNSDPNQQSPKAPQNNNPPVVNPPQRIQDSGTPSPSERLDPIPTRNPYNFQPVQFQTAGGNRQQQLPINGPPSVPSNQQTPPTPEPTPPKEQVSTSTSNPTPPQEEVDTAPPRPADPGQAAANQDASDEQSKKLVDDLMNGNYFTYFVDLNAQRSGSLFLNRENQENGPQVLQSQPTSTQTANNPSDSTPTTNNQPNEAPPAGTKTKIKPGSTQSGASLTSDGNQSPPQQSAQEAKPITGPTTVIKEPKPTPNQSQTVQQPIQQTNSQANDPPASSQREQLGSLNSIALCHSDSQCEYDYINFIALGLKIKCIGGACTPEL